MVRSEGEVTRVGGRMRGTSVQRRISGQNHGRRNTDRELERVCKRGGGQRLCHVTMEN